MRKNSEPIPVVSKKTPLPLAKRKMTTPSTFSKPFPPSIILVQSLPNSEWCLGHNRFQSTQWTQAAPAPPVWSYLPPVRGLKVFSFLLSKLYCPTSLCATDRGRQPSWPQQDGHWAPGMMQPTQIISYTCRSWGITALQLSWKSTWAAGKTDHMVPLQS